jgi:hypothetical protein
MSTLLGLLDIRRLLPELELTTANGDSSPLLPSYAQTLQKKGIEPQNFSNQSAHELLSCLGRRSREGLCTLRQAAALEKFEIPNPAEVLFKDVDHRLAEAHQKMLPIRIAKYLEKCAPAVGGQHGHTTAFFAALALVRGFALSQEEALPFLRQYNQRCKPPWSEEDLKYKLAGAANFKPSQKDFSAPGYLLNGDKIPLSVETASTPPPIRELKAQYESDYLRAFTAELGDITIDESYLEARSQFSCHNRSPAGFLHKLFRPGEHVWVTTNAKSGKGLIWTHDGPGQNLAELDHLRRGYAGVWYLNNPIDGKLHHAERLERESNPDGLSFRCTDCVTNWRYGVLESDDAPEDLWLKALVLLSLPLPIVAIYHSGKRAPHALFRVGANSHDHWNELVNPHRAHLIKLGACSGSLTALRFTRLPNCRREQTGQVQQLIYLSPNADSTPICRRPMRKSPLLAAVWHSGQRL